MSCSSKHKIAVQGVLGCMILLLGFWHIRYSYANKLNNKACTMADSEKAMRTIEKAIKLNPMNPVYYANMYNPQIQISAESETKRSIFREKDKTKRSKKESAQHSKSRNKSFVMTSVSAL